MAIVFILVPDQQSFQNFKFAAAWAILVKLKNILEETGLSTETNRAKKIGQLTGQFNKKHQGQFDSKKLKEIIEKMIM